MLSNFILILSQTFTGNRDLDSVVTQAIAPPIVARYVQIRPRGWRSHICMRVEFYGCPAGALLYMSYVRVPLVTKITLCRRHL